METIKIELDELDNGAINLYDNNQKIGEMMISLSKPDQEIMVFHTEVSPEHGGKGYAGKMLAILVSYARENSWKIVPLCPYVLGQFKKHPDQYNDVWKK